MAECVECGKKIGFLDPGTDGLCLSCAEVVADRKDLARRERATKAKEIAASRHPEQQQREKAINAILLTTETAPNLNITRRIEIVTAECAFGMNIFKDLFAAVRDVVGGRSEAIQETMRDSRRTALYELKKEAYEVGANAVVGVDLDYVELSAVGSMVMLVASGTAVVIE